MWAVNVAVFKTYDAAVASALVALFILLALLSIRLLSDLMGSGSAIISTKTIITLMCPEYEKYLQERAKAAKNSAYFWHNKVKEDLDCSTCG